MTDEQIERALERMGNSRCSDITNSDYLEALDYIKRLKAENKELKEKLQANLEKAYEKSEQECNRCMEKVEFKHGLSLDSVEERVRKETAKEILKDLKDRSVWFILGTAQFTQDHFWEQFEEMCQSYGIEVEE